MQKYRLSSENSPTSLLINRQKKLNFRFDGVNYQGYEGDSLASALLANGVLLLGRSFKYHRPRGLLAAGIEEPNALIQLENGARSQPNLPATMIKLYEGLEANSQNRWPSLRYDIGAVNGWLGRLFPAGFYYKTFMWPASFWEPIYEKFIRHAAGLGVAPTGLDPSFYSQRHHHCDLLVVGGGIAGLYAASLAAKAGLSVLIADEQSNWGGHVHDDPELGMIKGKSLIEQVKEWVEELQACPNVTFLLNTTVAGHYDDNYLIAQENVQTHAGPYQENPEIALHRLWKIRAKKVIIATGALDRPIVFANNDRPGIMLASALKSYMHRYGVLPGKQIAIFTNNDSAYRAAFAARHFGAQVRIIDSRALINSELHQEALEAGIEVRLASVVMDSKGGSALSMIKIATYQNGNLNSLGEWVTADCLAMSGGLTPIVHLFSQARGKLLWDKDLLCFKPDNKLDHVQVIGAANGDYELSSLLKETVRVIKATLADFDSAQALRITVPKASGGDSLNVEALWQVPHKKGQKAFHEFQNDSTAADIHLAAREGFISVEHLKRYTTTGMATDQGKTSNINAIAIMANIRNVEMAEVGTTTFRPPYSPISFGAITGQNRRALFMQERTTAMHADHLAMKAVFEDVGDWKRPYYFPRNGENMEQAVARECLQTRKSVGMVDASTLGKIDIQGEDAAWFLNMVYTNAWDNLAIGRSRYGLMCNEHGMVFDDGVTTKIADNHYHMTTTTGGAARVMNWLEEWLQTEWPNRKVYCTSVTEQWAVASINGPKARKMLQPITDIDLDNGKFPFMSMQIGKVANIPARVFRISFTGELGYEINVPARYGLELWQALRKAGEPFDLCLYGTETLHVLRAEKGYIIVGQDSDGTATPQDLGMSWIVSKKKADFLGKRSHYRSDTVRADRKQLVGILTEDPHHVIAEGAHILAEYKEKAAEFLSTPLTTLGHVTSSYMSSNLGRSIALAMIKGGRERIGQTLYIPDLKSKRTHKVMVCEPLFIDKEGSRQDGE